jgi:hypothetical protein
MSQTLFFSNDIRYIQNVEYSVSRLLNRNQLPFGSGYFEPWGFIFYYDELTLLDKEDLSVQ